MLECLYMFIMFMYTYVFIYSFVYIIKVCFMLFAPLINIIFDNSLS